MLAWRQLETGNSHGLSKWFDTTRRGDFSLLECGRGLRTSRHGVAPRWGDGLGNPWWIRPVLDRRWRGRASLRRSEFRTGKKQAYRGKVGRRWTWIVHGCLDRGW